MKALWHTRRGQAPIAGPLAPSEPGGLEAARPGGDADPAPRDALETRRVGANAQALGPIRAPRLAPRALPQRRVVDMLQATYVADEAARTEQWDKAAALLQQLAQQYPNQPEPLVRLMALGLKQGTLQPAAEHAFGRICPAPADQALAWLGTYGDRPQMPTHRAYGCTLANMLARYADQLSMPERRALLARAQTPTQAQPRPLLERTLQAEPYGDGAGLRALLRFCPSFWQQWPGCLDDALHKALAVGAKAVYRTLLDGGANPQSPLELALASVKNTDLAVFCAAIRCEPAIATRPFLWRQQHTEPVVLAQVVLDVAAAQAGPFIEALGRFGACMMAYPQPSALDAPWRLAMQAQGPAMRSFVDTVDNLEALDPYTKRSLLMDAAHYDYPWAVNLLIGRGADAARTHDATGMTALDFATTSGSVRCAALLRDPTQTRQMLNHLLAEEDPEVQTELIACVANAPSPKMRDAWYEGIRQIYHHQHGLKQGAALSRLVLQATAHAAPRDVLDYVAIAHAAPNDLSAKHMLEALAAYMSVDAVTALTRQMRRHVRRHQLVGRALYHAIERCVRHIPDGAASLLKNLSLFNLRGASDADFADILLGFLALARQPSGVAAWPEHSVKRCLEVDVSGPMRATMIVTSLAQTYQTQAALLSTQAQSAQPETKPSHASWKRTFLQWARPESTKASGAAPCPDAEPQAQLLAVDTLKHACAVARRTAPMLVRGPRACHLSDIEEISAACHDEHVIDAFDDVRVAEQLIALMQALLGDAILEQLFDAQAEATPDARVLRRMFLSMHPDRAPTPDDKPRFDAMTALLGEIYTWCKDAATPKSAPAGPLVLAYRRRHEALASAGESA